MKNSFFLNLTFALALRHRFLDWSLTRSEKSSSYTVMMTYEVFKRHKGKKKCLQSREEDKIYLVNLDKAISL